MDLSINFCWCMLSSALYFFSSPELKAQMSTCSMLSSLKKNFTFFDFFNIQNHKGNFNQTQHKLILIHVLVKSSSKIEKKPQLFLIFEIVIKIKLKPLGHFEPFNTRHKAYPFIKETDILVQMSDHCAHALSSILREIRQQKWFKIH